MIISMLYSSKHTYMLDYTVQFAIDVISYKRQEKPLAIQREKRQSRVLLVTTYILRNNLLILYINKIIG